MPAGSAEIAVEHSFPAPIGRVVAMYADQEFTRVRGLAVGASDCDVLVDGEPDSGFTVAIRRTLPTDRLQPEFRPFIGSTITVRYSEAWEPPHPEGWNGTFAVDILGVPAKASGTIRLLDGGEETTLTLYGTVAVHVPFLAGVVTKAVVEALDDAIAREIEAADAWLQDS